MNKGKMKIYNLKVIIFSVTALTVISSFIGCKTKEEVKVTTETNTINLGVIIPSEGDLWIYGREFMKGMNIAIEECNSSGGVKGKKIGLKLENNLGDPFKSAEAVKRFAEDSSVIAVIGPVTSNNTLAAAAIAEHEKIPLLSPYSTNIAVTEIGEYISRICFTDVFQARSMANFSRHSKGIKKAAILAEKGNNYSEGLASDFEKEFLKVGGEIICTEFFGKDDKSYKFFLEKIFRFSLRFFAAVVMNL